MAKQYSGRNIGLFIGKESVFGTPVAPTACLKQTGFSGGIKPEYVKSASRLGSRATAGQYQSSQIGGLTVPAEMDPENLGFFLKGLLGSETITTLVSGAYQHDFTMLNDSGLPSWTLVRQYGWKALRAIGAVLNTFNLSIAPKALVTGTAEYVNKSEDDQSISFLPAAVAIATDFITIAANPFIVGDAVQFYPASGGVLPAPLQMGVTYYVVTVSTNDIKVSLTAGGTALDLTSIGTGSFFITPWSVIQPTSARPFIYNDGFIAVDTVNFGEIRNAEVSFSNNLSTDDFRLNLAGQIASLPAGAFDAGGKATVIFNEVGATLLSKYLAGTECRLTITLDSGVKIGATAYNKKLIIDFGRAQLTDGGQIGTDEAGMKLDMGFQAFANPVSPVTISLINERATAY